MFVKRMIFVVTLFGLLLVIDHPVKAVQKGTHFELEMDAGAGFPVAVESAELPGYTTRIVLGVGARPRGWFPFFYFQTAFGFTGNDFSNGTFHLDRTTRNLLFGPRVVLPLIAGLRAFLETMIGPFWVENQLSDPAVLKDRKSTEVYFGYALSLGFQYRFLRNLSLGVRTEFVEEVKEGEEIANRLLIEENDLSMRFGVSAFVTAHF